VNINNSYFSLTLMCKYGPFLPMSPNKVYVMTQRAKICQVYNFMTKIWTCFIQYYTGCCHSQGHKLVIINHATTCRLKQNLWPHYTFEYAYADIDFPSACRQRLTCHPLLANDATSMVAGVAALRPIFPGGENSLRKSPVAKLSAHSTNLISPASYSVAYNY
jgi:hypothetical protein